MKKVFATLAVASLLAMSAAPALAGWWNRAPVKEMCWVSTNPDGTHNFALRTSSCVPFIGKSCLPQACLSPL